jgi:hypothetical protein
MKRLRKGCGSASTPMPTSCATARTSSPRSDASSPSTINCFSGYRGRNMSMLMLATIEARGTVGLRAKYRDPSRPFSSAVTATRSTDRLGFAAAMADAASIRVAMPDALSMAPL